MRHLFDTPLGAQVAPIGSFKNEGDMDVIALAGLGAGILGGIFGSANTEDTNDTNMKIALKTNQANKEINESQLAWARENYLDQKAENRFLVDQAYERQLENRQHEEEYNSPAAIRQRLVDAGFNPSMVLNRLGGSTGTGGSLSSVATGSAPKADVPAQIPMQASHVINDQSIQNALSKVSDLSTHYIEMEHDLAYKKQMANNDSLRALSDWSRTGVQNSYTQKLTDKLAKDMLFDEQSWDDRLESLRQANNLHKQQAILAEQQVAAQKFANEVFPELHDLQKRSLAMSICIGAAQVANIQANTSLTEQQKKTEIERTCQESIRRSNLPKSLHNDNALQVATYKQIRAQAGLVQQQTKSERWRTVDLSKNKYQTGTNREMRDYLNYATDAYDVIEKNNKRGFFRTNR